MLVKTKGVIRNECISDVICPLSRNYEVHCFCKRKAIRRAVLKTDAS